MGVCASNAGVVGVMSPDGIIVFDDKGEGLRISRNIEKILSSDEKRLAREVKVSFSAIDRETVEDEERKSRERRRKAEV
jgi:PAS domain-containing protein